MIKTTVDDVGYDLTDVCAAIGPLDVSADRRNLAPGMWQSIASGLSKRGHDAVAHDTHVRVGPFIVSLVWDAGNAVLHVAAPGAMS